MWRLPTIQNADTRMPVDTVTLLSVHARSCHLRVVQTKEYNKKITMIIKYLGQIAAHISSEVKQNEYLA